MPGTRERLWTDYEAHHRMAGNQWCHLVGIPLIIAGLLGLLAVPLFNACAARVPPPPSPLLGGGGEFSNSPPGSGGDQGVVSGSPRPEARTRPGLGRRAGRFAAFHVSNRRQLGATHVARASRP